MIGDKTPHHPDTSFVLHNFDSNSARLQQLLLSLERLIFADDDVRDAVEKNRATAHRTR
jgi:hypothetical protein